MLPAPCTAEGVVLDRSGEPIGGAYVVLSGWNLDRELFVLEAAEEPEPLGLLPLTWEARTDDDGRFRFTDLAPGAYSLGQAYPAGSLDPLHFELAPKEALTDLRVGSPDATVIAGTVLDFEGKPVGGAYVNLRRTDSAPGTGLEILTGMDGRFTFEVEREESYSIWAVANPLRTKTPEERVHAAGHDELRGGMRDLEVVLPPAVITNGRVVDEHGAPIAHVQVVARSTDGSLLGTETADSDGRFSLALPPGEVAQVSVASAAGYSPAPVLAGAHDLVLEPARRPGRSSESRR